MQAARKTTSAKQMIPDLVIFLLSPDLNAEIIVPTSHGRKNAAPIARN